MKKPLIFLLFFGNLEGIQAQNLEGIWISSNRMDVQTIDSSTYLEEAEFFTEKLEAVEVDTSYFEAYLLVHFFNNHEVAIHGIGGETGHGNYSQKIDTLILDIDSLTIKSVKRQDNLILLDPNSSGTNNHLIVEKLHPISDLKGDRLTSFFEKGSYWKVKTDSSSSNFGLEFQLLDSGEMVLSQFYPAGFAMTSWGNYKCATYENNLFLYLLDRGSLRERMFRMYSRSKNGLVAQGFEKDGLGQPFSKRHYLVEKSDLPKQKHLTRIHNALLGKWFLNEPVLPYDSLFGRYTTFEEQFYELEVLEQGDLVIHYGGVYVNENERKPLSRKIYGTWELGPTGRYLRIITQERRLEYMTIVNLSNDSLLITIDIEALDWDAMYSHHFLPLEKRNKN